MLVPFKLSATGVKCGVRSNLKAWEFFTWILNQICIFDKRKFKNQKHKEQTIFLTISSSSLIEQTRQAVNDILSIIQIAADYTVIPLQRLHSHRCINWHCITAPTSTLKHLYLHTAMHYEHIKLLYTSNQSTWRTSNRPNIQIHL